MNLIGAVVFGIALFAHQYEVTCQKCHSVIPRLNAFGIRFMANGNRIPMVEPGPEFPVSTKVNLAYTSANGGGLPKAIVDEVELFTAGVLGSRGSYFAEQYIVDGGQHGALREAWLQERVDPWNSRIPLSVMAGSFTLPLPVDPETFRESAQHYTPFDQSVGTNPLNFFEPKIGAKVSVGDLVRGTSLQFAALSGHDRFSGVQTLGTDFMIYAQHAMGAFSASAYNYVGSRPDGGLVDRFNRTGYGFVYLSRKWTSESVLTRGWDSSNGGIGVASGGGFTQLRYEISPRAFALARYEGTNDGLSGMVHDGVVLFGYRPSHNARVTIEDVITNTPVATHTLNLQYTVGY